MKNEMQIFKYNSAKVRTIIINGELWWVLKDVCDVLGIKNHKDVAGRLEEDEVGQIDLTDALGREQLTTIINEAGLYNVILRSDKPEAKEFKRWVTHEVLPSIRKHGAYMTPAKLEEVMNDPDAWIKMLTALKAERQQKALLEAKISTQDQIIGELKPKADYVDWILKNTGLVSITQIAKDYGMSGSRMNHTLHGLGIQYRQGEQWLLYRKYQALGYTHSETVEITRSDGRPDIKMSTKWTQKGRLFIYNMLKADGIVPIIERTRTA